MCFFPAFCYRSISAISLCEFPLQWRHNGYDGVSNQVYSGADQRKHQSSASLALLWCGEFTGDTTKTNQSITRRLHIAWDTVYFTKHICAHGDLPKWPLTNVAVILNMQLSNIFYWSLFSLFLTINEAIAWMPQDLTFEELILVVGMVWCLQATSLYMRKKTHTLKSVCP